MDFKKDLLLIDIEATGLDFSKHEIIQLGAVLLDRKSLREKQSFSSFVKPVRWQNRDRESMAVNKIAYAQVKDAPPLKEVLSDFDQMFGRDVVLSYYVGIMDIIFLQAAYKKAGRKWPFDYHTFNIWGFFYGVLGARGRLSSARDFGGFSLEGLIKAFKIKAEMGKLHDALVDCRVEAEVLRRIIKEIQK